MMPITMPTRARRGGATRVHWDFAAALLIGWVLLSAAGLLYAREKNIPAWAAVPVLAAFLFEYPFYLVPGFGALREQLEERFSRIQLAVFLAISGIVPYWIYSIGTGQFRWHALLWLGGLVAVVSFWYVILPHTRLADAALLVMMGAVILGKFFDTIYLAPVPVLKIEILGHLMLIRLGAMALLALRGMCGTGYGFLPERKDWKIGLTYFLLFVPIGIPLALGLRVIRFHWGGMQLWHAAAIFVGMFWVVALSEEFVFRGLLQRWFSEWMNSSRAGLVLASVVFGLCHLGFRSFPNWRFAAVAAIAGWFYGRAYQQAGSIRASMVTHALVITVWRVLFV